MYIFIRCTASLPDSISATPYPTGRHFKELEIKAFLEAGWPGCQVENYLFSLRDTMHKDPLLWRGIWVDAGLPGESFDKSLGSMPVPTSSKWECMPPACGKYVLTLEHTKEQTIQLGAGSQAKVGVSMMETFTHHVREMLRGSTQLERLQDAGKHRDKVKFEVLAVELEKPQLTAGIFAIIDMAEAHTSRFHHWTCGRCAMQHAPRPPPLPARARARSHLACLTPRTRSPFVSPRARSPRECICFI